MDKGRLSAIRSVLEESSRVKLELFGLAEEISSAAELLIECIKSGHKVMFCGNGGSAADSQHMSCELVEKFTRRRKALPAMALTTDTSILTAVPNDESFDLLFSRQIEALGKAGDVLVAISTSGSSPNVLKALQQAKGMGIHTIGLTGAQGEGMAEGSELLIKVPSTSVPRIQECHITIGHILCELVESELA
ncbi:MAG: SIS domain-containing protein [bacterium]